MYAPLLISLGVKLGETHLERRLFLKTMGRPLANISEENYRLPKEWFFSYSVQLRTFLPLHALFSSSTSSCRTFLDLLF